MCHAMSFSARALKKTFSLKLILCGKKQIEMWFFVVCTLVDNEYASVMNFSNSDRKLVGIDNMKNKLE